jgi:hypothetical protein
MLSCCKPFFADQESSRRRLREIIWFLDLKGFIRSRQNLGFLIVLLLLAVFASATSSPADPLRPLVGALRWDNWRIDSMAGDFLDAPMLKDRIPYFVVRGPGGKLELPGDDANVLQADVIYANAAGIDYFIFGYYLETKSWGRDLQAATRLNSAYRSYQSLPDRAGVKFALSFNMLFPKSDIPTVIAVLTAALKQKDYARGADGSAPVFFFAPRLATWVKALGGEVEARRVFLDLKARVQKSTGTPPYFIALLFDIDNVGPLAARVGFDAISTYANGLGGGDRAVPYAACANGARSFWHKGAQQVIGFLPTVTLGWDYRPILEQPNEAAHRDPHPSWCAPGSDTEWIAQIRAALKIAATDPKNGRFDSIVLYAWNEFGEGGWIAPTVGEGTRRLQVILEALGRRENAAKPSVTLNLPLRSAGDAMTMDWPCPPGYRVGQDREEISKTPPKRKIRVCVAIRRHASRP